MFPQFVRQDVPLSVYTRLQLGGTAEFFAEPENETELTGLLKLCRQNNVPVRILGAGSNLLVPDDEPDKCAVPGMVISLASPEFCRITVNCPNVTAGAGAIFGQVITHSVSAGLGGIEAFVGMPGSFGGAVCSNTGTMHGGDLGQWVESVRVCDFAGNIAVLPKNEITFAYRYSSLENAVMLSATLRLEQDDPKELAKRMRKLWIIRKSQQPAGDVASVLAFKNPESGPSAGLLIEQAGLKGMRVGGAVISEHNAEFITVDAECTSGEVLQLIRSVQEQVARNAEIDLELALNVW